MSSDRPRHPKPELERLCRDVEKAGWRITRGKRYFKAYCACGKHKRTIHLSPSDPNYEKHARSWFRRQPCWPKDI